MCLLALFITINYVYGEIKVSVLLLQKLIPIIKDNP